MWDGSSVAQIKSLFIHNICMNSRAESQTGLLSSDLCLKALCIYHFPLQKYTHSVQYIIWFTDTHVCVSQHPRLLLLTWISMWWVRNWRRWSSSSDRWPASEMTCANDWRSPRPAPPSTTAGTLTRALGAVFHHWDTIIVSNFIFFVFILIC